MPNDSGQAGADLTIKVTPEMIQAGVAAFRDWLGDGRSSESIMPDEVSKSISARPETL